MGLIVRIVDEMRFGLRDVDIDDVRTIAGAWSLLNEGMTPSETALRHLGHADGSE
jgi:hypothetical protein